MPSSRRAAAEGLDAAAIEEARDADEPKVACFPMGNGCFVTIYGWKQLLRNCLLSETVTS